MFVLFMKKLYDTVFYVCSRFELGSDEPLSRDFVHERVFLSYLEHVIVREHCLVYVEDFMPYEAYSYLKLDGFHRLICNISDFKK